MGMPELDPHTPSAAEIAAQQRRNLDQQQQNMVRQKLASAETRIHELLSLLEDYRAFVDSHIQTCKANHRVQEARMFERQRDEITKAVRRER